MSDAVADRCPICEAESEIMPVRQKYDDRYGYAGLFSIVECSHCGHKFLQQKFTPEFLQDLYSNYYPRSNYELEKHQPYKEVSGFSAWLDGSRYSTFRWVPKGVRVLDIGCGFGESLGYHKSRGCAVYGVEADENIRRVADRYGYDVHVGLFDPQQYEPDFFDYVTMSQVIEHVSNPKQTLKEIATILKPGGVAILSTPNVNGWGAVIFRRYWINWHVPYHLHFFSSRVMRQIAQQSGLILERVETVTPSQWLYHQWVHLMSYPEAGTKSDYWMHNHNWTIRQRIVLKLLMIMHRLKINHLITRFFDGCKLGDNSLYFFRKPS